MDPAQRPLKFDGCDTSRGKNVIHSSLGIPQTAECGVREIKRGRHNHDIECNVNDSFIDSTRIVSPQHNSSSEQDKALRQWIDYVRDSYNKGIPYEEIYAPQHDRRNENEDWSPSKSSYVDSGCKKLVMVGGRYEIVTPPLSPEVMKGYYTVKDDILYQMSRVESEINSFTSQIDTLKRRSREIEESAEKKQDEQSNDDVRPKSFCLFQQVYTDNKRKAIQAERAFDHIIIKMKPPLYNQPRDTAVYHRNLKAHAVFKHRLVEHLRHKHVWRSRRKHIITETYTNLMREWLQKVEKEENSQKRKTKDAKNRDVFEKVFPELRKQREERERFNRIGARMRSEADIEEFMISLQEQEQINQKMSTSAVIPPIMLDPEQRKLRYTDNNGLIVDLKDDYETRKHLNIWTESEQEIFKEKYLQHPKDFAAIASYLENKSVNDCIRYYYLSKKVENYKRLLRKNRHRTRSGRNNQPTRTANILSSPPADVPANLASSLSENTQSSTSSDTVQINLNENVSKCSVDSSKLECSDKNVKESTNPLPVETEVSSSVTSVLNSSSDDVICVEDEEQPAVGLAAITPINPPKSSLHTDLSPAPIPNIEKHSPETVTHTETSSNDLLRYTSPPYSTRRINSPLTVSKYPTELPSEIRIHQNSYPYPYTVTQNSVIPPPCSASASNIPPHEYRGHRDPFQSSHYLDVKNGNGVFRKVEDLNLHIERGKFNVPVQGQLHAHNSHRIPQENCSNRAYVSARNNYGVHIPQMPRNISAKCLNPLDCLNANSRHVTVRNRSDSCEAYGSDRLYHGENISGSSLPVQRRNVYEHVGSAGMNDDLDRSDRKRFCSTTFYNSVDERRQPPHAGLYTGITDTPLIYRRA